MIGIWSRLKEIIRNYSNFKSAHPLVHSVFASICFLNREINTLILIRTPIKMGAFNSYFRVFYSGKNEYS